MTLFHAGLCRGILCQGEQVHLVSYQGGAVSASSYHFLCHFHFDLVRCQLSSLQLPFQVPTSPWRVKVTVPPPPPAPSAYPDHPDLLETKEEEVNQQDLPVKHLEDAQETPPSPVKWGAAEMLAWVNTQVATETHETLSPMDWNVEEVVTWIKTLQGGAFATSLVFESCGFFHKSFQPHTFQECSDSRPVARYADLFEGEVDGRTLSTMTASSLKDCELVRHRGYGELKDKITPLQDLGMDKLGPRKVGGERPGCSRSCRNPQVLSSEIEKLFQ